MRPAPLTIFVLCAALLCGLAFAGLACRTGESAAPPKPPAERTVVSLVPSVTETLFDMGLGDRVIGRSRYCTYPPEVADLPVLGDAVSVNVEKLLALSPDLVIFNTSDTDRYDRLASAGIRCIAPRMETVEDVYHVIELLGDELGAEGAAAGLAGDLRAELAAVEQRAAARRAASDVPTLVTFPESIGAGGEVRVVGRDTFVSELLDLVGGRNVVDATGYPKVSIETVVTWAPEVIIISAPGDVAPGLSDDQYRDPWRQWPAIPAVDSGRIVVLREPYLTLPGPRMGQAAHLLERAIRGEAVPPAAGEAQP